MYHKISIFINFYIFFIYLFLFIIIIFSPFFLFLFFFIIYLPKIFGIVITTSMLLVR